MKIGYADPPYIGCAHLYPENCEVDHYELAARLSRECDGWILHGAATPRSMAILGDIANLSSARVCAWVKGFAAFKANVSVAYAWEPVIIKAARKPVVSGRIVMRDWIQCSITLERGLTGAKPEAVCHWAFELVGAEPDDELADLYPGTGAVTKAWESWRRQLTLGFAGGVVTGVAQDCDPDQAVAGQRLVPASVASPAKICQCLGVAHGENFGWECQLCGSVYGRIHQACD